MVTSWCLLTLMKLLWKDNRLLSVRLLKRNGRTHTHRQADRQTDRH